MSVLWAAAPLGCMVLGLFLVLLIAIYLASLQDRFALRANRT
ncbi:MAG TPA: hypothetical protein VGN93_21840 [Shinella sp.]|nr:hypothetical protein [Shinella sp.]